MPATKQTEPREANPAPQVNKELELFKGKVNQMFNERYQKLTQASANATNVWDRLTLENRIKELTDLFKLIADIK